MDTTILEVQVPEDLRDTTSAICARFGISLPAAIRLFLKRMVIENGLPFPVTLPRSGYKSQRTKKAPGYVPPRSETALEIPMPQDLRDKATAVCEVLGISPQPSDSHMHVSEADGIGG